MKSRPVDELDFHSCGFDWAQKITDDIAESDLSVDSAQHFVTGWLKVEAVATLQRLTSNIVRP